jgi:hypothetical protein
MASQNTTLFAAQIGSADYASGQALPTALDAGGRTTTICDTFTTTSAVTANSQTITLCKLPAGAKVVSLELIVPASVGTSSAKIGYGTIAADGTVTVVDDDRWGSGKDLSSAGRVQFVSVAADADYVTTTEVAVVLSPVTTNFATAIAFLWIITYVTA